MIYDAIKASQAALRRMGLDVKLVSKLPKMTGEFEILTSMLNTKRIGTILDVGANVGQFAMSVFQAGYGGRVISVEPMPAAWEQLSIMAKENVSWKWTAAPRMALGKKDGVDLLNIAGNSISSSLLPMSELHSQAAPKSTYVDGVRVSVRRLDDVFQSLVGGDRDVFLKIDTQGTEMDVLEGARGVLDFIQGMKIEMSFVELYRGQPVFDDLFSYVRSLGFEVWEVTPGFRDPNNLRRFQCDWLFFRR